MRLKLHKTRTVYRDVRNPRVREKEWQPTWAGGTRVKHAFFFFFFLSTGSRNLFGGTAIDAETAA